MSVLPKPAEMGLPEQFTEWRNGQDVAVVDVVGSDCRFIAMALPTGAGKSLIGVALSTLLGNRGAYITSTKGLQDQIGSDFRSVGVVDIRGQNNYPCVAKQVDPNTPCDLGPCHAGFKCELKQGGCVYYDQVRKGMSSPLPVSNYSYWLHQKESESRPNALSPFRNVEVLVLDEAHQAEQELADYLSVELTAHDAEGPLGIDRLPEWDTVEQWVSASKQWHGETQLKLNEYRNSSDGTTAPEPKILRYVKHLKTLERKLYRLANSQGRWVCEVVRRGPMGERVARFQPTEPKYYAEKCLFAGVEKVILLSATLTPKTLELLGIKEGEYAFTEAQSSFPIQNRLVTYIPTVRVDKRAQPEDMRQWVNRIDDIVGQRLDRKGIVHCVSYARAHFLARHSEHRDVMMLHDSGTTRSVVEKFRKSSPPAVLVSPSVTTGYDFPDDQARYQILGKVPFPDTRDVVLKARAELDPDYPHYLAMQTIVQSAGRGVRSETDSCETFIIDDNWTWFWGKYKKFSPKWFEQAVKRSQTVPKPLVLAVTR